MTHEGITPRRLLISRTDRAGDLLLTLPVFAAARAAWHHVSLIAHVRSYTAPLLRGQSEIDETLIDPAATGFSGLRELVRAFRQAAPDAAVIVHPAPRVLVAAWLAGIPIRVGRASNAWQFLLNRRCVQHRSRNERHEYEYNLDLLSGLGLDLFAPTAPQPVPTPRLQLREEAVITGHQLLQAAGWHPDESPGMICVHPGHGGSANNLRPGQYLDLCRRLLERGFAILATFGPGEADLLPQFKALGHPRLHIVDAAPDLEALAGVLSHCDAFVGGSTGPLHLAAALGKPTAAFFPPRPSMTPKRWGPVGNESLVRVPPITDCPSLCDGCSHHPCLEAIDLAPVIDWLGSKAAGKRGPANLRTTANR